MVRLEREGTSGSVFDELYFGADITHEQPPYARAMLAAQNATGRYFEFYAARNYFDRAKDHGATALHNEKAGDVAPTATQRELPPRAPCRGAGSAPSRPWACSRCCARARAAASRPG